MLSGSLIASLLITSTLAMMKVFCVVVVGAFIAQYPRDSPYMPPASLKYVSRLSNSVFLPCLIISALGSSLTPTSLSMMAILILFAIINTLLSYILAITIGKYLNKDDKATFESLVVAIASPNAISLPIMVMSTLCEQPIVYQDFGNDIMQCQVEATAMLFVYSVGWHLLYWSFGFPELERIKRELIDGDGRGSSATVSHSSTSPTSRLAAVWTYIQDWFFRVALSGVMIAIVLGVIVGSWPQLKSSLFAASTVIRPIGSALVTLGQPVVALNSVVMAASLASVPKEELFEQMQRFCIPCTWFLACAGYKNKNIDIIITSKQQNNVSNTTSTSSNIEYTEVSSSDPVQNPIRDNGGGIVEDSLDDININININKDIDEENVNRKQSSCSIDIMLMMAQQEGPPLGPPPIDTSSNKAYPPHHPRIRAHSEDVIHDPRCTDEDFTHLSSQLPATIACAPNASARHKESINNNISSSSCSMYNNNNNNNNNNDDDDNNNSNNGNNRSSSSCSDKCGVGKSTIAFSASEAVETKPSAAAPIIKYHSDRLILIHTLCRLILPPIIMIALVRLIYANNPAANTGFYRLLRLVVVVESGSPSAQVIMVCLQQLEVPYLATRLSYMYIYHYLLAIVTITISTSVIMSMLYYS